MLSSKEILTYLTKMKTVQIQSILLSLKECEDSKILSSNQKIIIENRLMGRKIQLEEDIKLYEDLIKD